METLFIIVMVRAKVTFEDNLNFQKKKKCLHICFSSSKNFQSCKAQVRCPITTSSGGCTAIGKEFSELKISTPGLLQL